MKNENPKLIEKETKSLEKKKTDKIIYSAFFYPEYTPLGLQ
jgi:hypothetical protein